MLSAFFLQAAHFTTEQDNKIIYEGVAKIFNPQQKTVLSVSKACTANHVNYLNKQINIQFIFGQYH